MQADGERFIEGQSAGREIFLQHAGRYLFAGAYVAGKTVLDAACGSGFGSELLSRSASEVTGVDISPEAVEYCRARYTKRNLRFRQMSCSALDFPDASFDAVVSFETIEHLPEPGAFLAEIKRVLKPGGRLIMSTPNRENFAIYTKGEKNPFHVKELSAEEFVELVGGYLKLETLLGQRYFSPKDVPLLAAYSAGPVPYGRDSLLQRAVRVILRSVFPESILSRWLLRAEIWANKCGVGDIAPDKAVFVVGVWRKI